MTIDPVLGIGMVVSELLAIRTFCVYVHDRRDEALCSSGGGYTVAELESAIAEALESASRDLKCKTETRDDLAEPCLHCGAITKADVEFLCLSLDRASHEADQPCHGEAP